jgi:choline dehydrogenase-like flavoprotein
MKRLLLLLLAIVPQLWAASTADYVVVGVGTAGGRMARRLSDDKKTSVIALHNGPNLTQDPLIECSQNAIVTVLSALLGQLDPNINPLYQTGFTTPQPDADNRELFWAMGLPEGGASSINAGAWCRGTDQLYAQWEAIAGPEWSVARIGKTYRKLEHYKGKTPNPELRGHHGPIEVRQDPNPSAVAQTFTQAMIEATGFPFVLDYNDPLTPIGISAQLQYTQMGHNGALRGSSASIFLNDEVMSSNGHGKHGRKLRVHFNSTALRTIWEWVDGLYRAVGVEYLQDGVTKQVFATKGVIVCAGLYSSPFLMHSGVGPSAVLTPLDIPVIFDNPNVGQQLADQPHIVCAFTSDPADTPESSAGIFAQISWLPTPGGDPTSRQLRLATINPVPGITAGLLDLVQPLSRGSITINSADPTMPPVIDYGALTDPADLTTYIAGFQTYMKALNIALQQINPLYGLVSPDPAILDDTVALTAFIREEIGANQHWQSHCRMAPLADGGVVDSRGRVYGVDHLYVADNSVNPQNMDGSPMATAYLVADRIAQMIIDNS